MPFTVKKLLLGAVGIRACIGSDDTFGGVPVVGVWSVTRNGLSQTYSVMLLWKNDPV